MVRIQGDWVMFQYAFAKAIAVKYGTAVALDNSGFETDLFISRRDYRLDILMFLFYYLMKLLCLNQMGSIKKTFSKLRKKQ
jgi:hypothetical protein